MSHGLDVGRAPVTGCATTVCGVQRLCERPGCGAPSDASYGIDRLNLVVWVDTAAVAERETAGRLCRRHANALMVPRGWTLDDRRDPVPRLFKVREPEEQPGDAPRDKKREKKQSGSSRPRRRPSPSDTPGLFESIRREIDTTPAGSVPATEVEPLLPELTVDEAMKAADKLAEAAAELRREAGEAAEELAKLAGEQLEQVAKARDAVEQLPWAAHASVERVWPGTVRVRDAGHAIADLLRASQA